MIVSLSWGHLLSWYRLIDDARSSTELLAVTRDYLATWEPRELARLPPACRPGRMKDESDIEELHACLVEEYRRNRLGGEEFGLMQKLTGFMVRVAVRLAHLRGEDGSGEGDGGGGGGDTPRPAGTPPADARDR